MKRDRKAVMDRLKDLWLEIRIEHARRRFVQSQKSKSQSSYELMYDYFKLCNQRKDRQVSRMEKRFM